MHKYQLAHTNIYMPSPLPPYRLTKLMLTLLCGIGAAAQAQEGLKLKAQTQISDASAKEAKGTVDQGLIFLRADKVSGVLDDEINAEGNAEMRKRGLIVKADVLRYQSVNDLAEAKGNVVLNREGNIYTGPELKLTTETGEGVFRLPTYRLAKTGGGGTASRIKFLDKRRSVAYDTTYTTCPRDDVAWQLTADEVQLDFDEEEGVGTDVKLTFKGMPLIVAPKLSFPLSDKRRSGFLPPQIGLSTNSGVEYAQPYYWDIAPNRDLTFTPTIITKRGVLFGNEFRYLGTAFQGQVQADWLPRDALRQQDQRWGVGLRHTGTLLGAVSYSANLARVGDDDYWKDLPRSISDITQSTLTATQRQLPADFNASYSIPYGYINSRFLRYQTLLNLSIPGDISKPYDIEPQIAGHWERLNWRGFDTQFDAQWTRFRHETSISGERNVFAPSISYPIQAPGYFAVPKLNLRQMNYRVNSPLADGRSTASITIPTLSLDTGLVFERSTGFFGKPYLQTLEPRAFLVNTPYRDQSLLPNFDAALLDLSFASIYSDNAYSGYDRVSDDKTLTIGLSSRVLEEATGAERLRLQFAQRVRFADQRVTTTNVPNTERLSDALFGVSFSPNDKVAFDTTVQYNPDIRRSVRSVLGARYTPAPFKTLAFGYSLNRNAPALEQYSVAWQWPLDFAGLPQLYTVGRVNYSREESRVTDAIAGLEWERACWLFRLVGQRTSQDVKTSSTRLYLQLELKGLTRLGTNPLSTLMSNIPQYRILGQPAERPSPYNTYE
jgi:LPS-assembly protein